MLVPLLAQMKGLQSLSASRNRITVLPKDLSSLKTLERLDLSSNPFPNLAAVLHGLQSLPALRHLIIDLPFASEEDLLIAALPQLESFNGRMLVDDATSAAAGASKSVRATYWTTGDSSRAEHLFADVTEASGGATRPKEYFDYLNRVVKHVTCLTASDDDPLCQEGEVLKARRLLLDYCFSELNQYITQKDPVLGRGVAALLKYDSFLGDSYDAHWRRVIRDRDTRFALMKQDMKEAIAQIETLMTQLAASGLSEPNEPSAHSANTQRHRVSPSALFTPERTAQQTPTHRTTLGQHRDAGAEVQRSPSHPRVKVLTLKQLKDVIEDIYASKSKYDAKCRDCGLPRETMEQHMYTYLNQRYGLKEIIQEYAVAIVQAVRRYATADNDVAVFGKVLRNEVDEEFRYVQRQVRDTIRELVRSQIKEKHKLRGDAEINGLLRRKMAGFLTEKEWLTVVQYMYSQKDAATLASLIHHHTYEKLSADSTCRGQPSATASIPYADVVRILSNFQLDGHERFLAPYVAIFRDHDRDQNGIISGTEFMAICRTLDPTKGPEELETLLHEIDPRGTQLITFSETVQALDSEIVKLSGM